VGPEVFDESLYDAAERWNARAPNPLLAAANERIRELEAEVSAWRSGSDLGHQRIATLEAELADRQADVDAISIAAAALDAERAALRPKAEAAERYAVSWWAKEEAARFVRAGRDARETTGEMANRYIDARSAVHAFSAAHAGVLAACPDQEFDADGDILPPGRPRQPKPPTPPAPAAAPTVKESLTVAPAEEPREVVAPDHTEDSLAMVEPAPAPAAGHGADTGYTNYDREAHAEMRDAPAPQRWWCEGCGEVVRVAGDHSGPFVPVEAGS
jgi:hypothetical protein